MNESEEKATLIYHDMRVHETFEQCAQRIFSIIRSAQESWPGKPRILHLDIQGHRNSAGGYDSDAFDIMQDFIITWMMPYLSEASTPLCRIKNSEGQRNDVPDELRIIDPERHKRTTSRDKNPVKRRSKPTLRAIAEYLGIGDPCCMICWGRPVERAHAQPAALEGSNDVRNFALLCPRHHKSAPDVRYSNDFWQWVDWKLDTEGPFSGKSRTQVIAKETEFFAEVRHELLELYGWNSDVIDQVDWSILMREYFAVLDAHTSGHFGVKRKVATHAWALHRALSTLIMSSSLDDDQVD